MQRAAGLLFILLYAALLARPVLPYVEYALNQAYIAEVLCINKERPQLKCDGKCYLNAQLQKAAEPESSSPALPATPIQEFEVTIAWQTAASVTVPVQQTGMRCSHPLTSDLALSQQSTSPLTPPPRRLS